MNDLQNIELAGAQFTAIGNADLLNGHKIGLLCSRRCPALTILEAHERFKHFASVGMTVVSGFHSPLEQECLRLMLRDGGNIIFCAARGLGRMLIKKEWRPALSEGRLLFISTFKPEIGHITKEQTRQRNQLVVRLADELYTPFIQTGGALEKILRQR